MDQTNSMSLQQFHESVQLVVPSLAYHLLHVKRVLAAERRATKNLLSLPHIVEDEAKVSAVAIYKHMNGREALQIEFLHETRKDGAFLALKSA